MSCFEPNLFIFVGEILIDPDQLSVMRAWFSPPLVGHLIYRLTVLDILRKKIGCMLSSIFREKSLHVEASVVDAREFESLSFNLVLVGIKVQNTTVPSFLTDGSA